MSLAPIVYENLANAMANGEFKPGGALYKASPESIASDLASYAEDCEDFTEEQLVPHVRKWFEFYPQG